MKKLKLTLLSLVALFGVMVAVPQYAHASAKSEILGGTSSVNSGSSTDLASQLKIVVNVLLYILGAIAVIMIVIGGIRYTTSNGDAGSTKSAKDTVLYAVVGLIVAVMAYAIVNFVVTAFN
jgi:hypothetical protein